MTAFVAVSCGVVGLAVGSFLNVVIHRVPAKESVVRPRSRCPQCKTELASRDNIPVVSWLLLRGKCRTCGTAISARYPLVEVFTAALFAACGARFADSWALPAYLLLFASLIAISAIDLELYIIPNRIVYPTLFAGAALLVAGALGDGDPKRIRNAAIGGAAAWCALLVVHFIQPRGMGFGDVRLSAVLGMYLGWIDLELVLLAAAAFAEGDPVRIRNAAIGGAAAWFSLLVVPFIQPKGMGFGDVRLSAVLGMYLGWIDLELVLLGMLLGFLLGAVIGLGLVVTRLRSRKDAVPFGPFLAAGAVIAILASEPIVRWYGV
jgi:leader peptidase (prepilin peptidase)/N-methyltransferase